MIHYTYIPNSQYFRRNENVCSSLQVNNWYLQSKNIYLYILFSYPL